MEIKLLGPWTIRNGCPERYYAVVYHQWDHDVWVVAETGWEKLFSTPEICVRIYNPFNKGEFIKRIPKGIQFNFSDFQEYIACCALNETTEDGWPLPSWAVACELPELDE